MVLNGRKHPMSAQALLLGNLLSPTWREVLIISRQILASISNLSLPEKMLKVLGSADMGHGEVESLFTQCFTAFEYAKEIIVLEGEHRTSKCAFVALQVVEDGLAIPLCSLTSRLTTPLALERRIR